MALPASGPISGSQIGTELGIVSGPYSLRNMSASASFSTPDAMSEFYGYSGDVYVDINVCFPNFADCYGSYTATAKSYLSGTSTPVNVNTNVTVDAYFYGDLGGYIYFPLVIASGTSCDSSYEPATYVSCVGEYYSYDGVSVSPFDSGNQFYSVGSTSTGLCSC